MADTPIPVSPAVPPTPAPIPVPPAPPQAVSQGQVVPQAPSIPQGSEDTSSNLSPFKLLAKKEGAGTVVPPPVSQPGPVLSQSPQAASAPVLQPTSSPQEQGGILVAKPSREELLKQAAEAPAASFILPPPEVIATPSPDSKPLISQVPRPVAPPPPRTEKPQPAQQVIPPRQGVLRAPTAPIVPLSAQQLPGQQRPVGPRLGSAPSLAPKQMGSVPLNGGVRPSVPGRVTPAVQTALSRATSAGFATRPKRRGVLGTLVISFSILAVVGSGVAYVMAKSGTRVPVLYTMLSGLEPAGQDATTQALAYVQARTRYQVQGEVELVEADMVDGTGKPQLPSAGDASAGRVYRLKAQIGRGEVSEKGAQSLSSVALTINQNDPIQVAMKQVPQTGDTDNWRAHFSSNDTPELVSFKGSLVAKTLLLPVLQTIPLETLLATPTGELAYQKLEGTQTGTSIAAHQFTVGTDKIKGYFPVGATLENFTLITRYAWAQGTTPAGQPVSVDLKGKVTYQQKVYTYTAVWRYGNWDKALESSEDTSGGLVKVTGSESPTAVSMVNATAQMGILSLESLPHTLTVAEAGSGSVGGPIVPSGETITAAGTRITTAPPIPTTPASAEAKLRDTQRQKDLADIKRALTAYKTATGSYPVSLTLLQTVEGGVLLSGLVATYMTGLPVDPTKTVYWYEYTSNGTTFSLRAVAEDPENATVKKGTVFSYFEVTN